jgi:hypothetical protein
VANVVNALKKKSIVLSVMLWWLRDKVENSGLQEEMLKMQLHSNHRKILEKNSPILNL